MKEFSLTTDQKRTIEQAHRRERDSNISDRLKAVLLRNEGWGYKAIAQALRIHEETARTHVKAWLNDNKVNSDYKGSQSKLSESESLELTSHLETQIYTKVSDICLYVAHKYQKTYTVSGMTKWLKQAGFSYKKPKGVPAKIDSQAQESFIKKYLDLLADTSAEEPILFADSVHPTMGTKVSYGWIRTGKDKLIKQTASRTRINIIGAINLSTMDIIHQDAKTVNADYIVEFLERIKAKYSAAPKIHLIVDQAGYHRAELTQSKAKELGIELHYLPPYSPNLNPIERLWKVMNEYVRDNRFFSSAKAFRQEINHFFDSTVDEIKHILRNRITDDFQVIENPVNSS